MLNADLTAVARSKVIEVTEPWWSGDSKSDGGLIYGRNLDGSSVPLVWCFQGHQEFVALARALGPNQPLYGMRSGHLVLEHSQFDLRHLAVACVEDLLSLGLARPIRLGGNCQGGMLAQKMAEYLVFLGHSIELLCIVNPMYASPYGGRAVLILGNSDVTNPFLRFHDAGGVWQANYPRGSFETIPSEHGKVFRGPTLTALANTLHRLLAAGTQTTIGSVMLGDYRVELSAPEQLSVAPNCFFEFEVRVKNASSAWWPPTVVSNLWVGNHWLDAQGRTSRWLDGRVPLNDGLAPGEEAAVVLTMRSPAEPGEYLAQIDLEHAGLFWLSERGDPCTSCRVTVLPDAGMGGA